MKINYETPHLQIELYTDDVLTSSFDWQGEYDDKGSWKDAWNTSESED